MPRPDVAIIALSGLLACSGIIGLDDVKDGAGGADGSGGSTTTTSTPASSGSGAGGMAGGGGGGARPWVDGYPVRMLLTLDTTVVDTDLVDFPTPVRIVDHSALKDLAMADGRDLVFTASDGVTRLSHEVEWYDAGSLVAWVRLPLVVAKTETDIYLYVGSGTLESQQDVVGTWPDTIYRGVWHMNEDPTGPEPQIRDRTAFGSDGIISDDPQPVSGIAAGALSFDGDFDTVTIDDADHLDLDANGFSASCWVHVTAPQTTGERPLQKIGGGVNYRGFIMRLGTGPWHGEVADGTSPAWSVGFGSEPDHNGSWTQVALVFEPTDEFVYGYGNGAVQSTSVAGINTSSLTNSEPFYISPGGDRFRGGIDEVRLYGHAVSPDWLKLERHALTANGYLTVGPEESP